MIVPARLMSDQAREWHRSNPEFMLDALRSFGRAQTLDETDLALHYHAEALDIGFWSKKDIVQYVTGCLHARGSLMSIPTFRQFLDHFTDADRDILQQFIDTAPIHWWSYAAAKSRAPEGEKDQ